MRSGVSVSHTRSENPAVSNSNFPVAYSRKHAVAGIVTQSRRLSIPKYGLLCFCETHDGKTYFHHAAHVEY